MNENTRLVRTAKPETDESFVGYIVRLTEKNIYQKATWILELSKLRDGEKSSDCAFVFKSYESLSLLAQLTGVHAAELAQLTYPRVTTQGPAPLHWFSGQPVPQYVLQLTRPKICPNCLSEKLYCRRIWENSFVTTCPVHKRLLIDECPGCQKRIAPLRSNVSVCSCKFDWRESPPLPIREEELVLTRHIYHLCGLPIDNNASAGQWKQSPIMALSLQDLISTVVFIAGQYQGISSATSKHLTPGTKNKDLHELFTKAYSVFENWPEGYYRFLDWKISQEKKPSSVHQRLKSPLYLDFGKFYTGLHKILSASPFDFMRSAFFEYLVANWQSSYVSNLCQVEPIYGSSKYISKSDARRILRTDYRSIDKFIEIGKLKSIIRSKGKKRLIFVDITGLLELWINADRGNCVD